MWGWLEGKTLVFRGKEQQGPIHRSDGVAQLREALTHPQVCVLQAQYRQPCRIERMPRFVGVLQYEHAGAIPDLRNMRTEAVSGGPRAALAVPALFDIGIPHGTSHLPVSPLQLWPNFMAFIKVGLATAQLH